MFKQQISMLVLNYFRFFAKRQLRKNSRAIIIGITGSAGKTSTRLAIAHILKTRGIVKQSLHANSQSGISLNILGLSPRNYSLLDWLRLMIMAPVQWATYDEHFDYYIVEMGIDGPDAPKNMQYLLSILTPSVGVVLGASLTHAQSFDYLVKDKDPKRRMLKLIHLIAKEKMQLLKAIRNPGVAIVNLDQKELSSQLKDVTCRRITFGTSKQADLQILKGFRFRYQGITHELKLTDVFDDRYAYTFAAAIATVASLGIPPSLSLKLLSQYRAPAGRLRLLPGINHSIIIDSSYNASPSTMSDALVHLKRLAGRHKAIAVLGDMRELGQSAKLAHKQLALQIISHCDEVILYGKLTQSYTLPLLLSRHFPVHHFTGMAELTKYLRTIISPKSYILVKGSQNEIFLERAVQAILADPSDVAHLCRRGEYWDNLRAKTP